MLILIGFVCGGRGSGCARRWRGGGERTLESGYHLLILLVLLRHGSSSLAASGIPPRAAAAADGVSATRYGTVSTSSSSSSTAAPACALRWRPLWGLTGAGASVSADADTPGSTSTPLLLGAAAVVGACALSHLFARGGKRPALLARGAPEEASCLGRTLCAATPWDEGGTVHENAPVDRPRDALGRLLLLCPLTALPTRAPSEACVVCSCAWLLDACTPPEI